MLLSIRVKVASAGTLKCSKGEAITVCSSLQADTLSTPNFNANSRTTMLSATALESSLYAYEVDEKACGGSKSLIKYAFGNLVILGRQVHVLVRILCPSTVLSSHVLRIGFSTVFSTTLRSTSHAVHPL